VPTFDAYYTLESLIRSKSTGAAGAFNYGGYSNAKVDALIDAVKTEVDDAKRTAMIREAFAIHAKEFGTIPLHDQVIPWAMKKNRQMITSLTIARLLSASRLSNPLRRPGAHPCGGRRMTLPLN
jgi:peptide/nickel transport system substrate-binding protein